VAVRTKLERSYFRSHGGQRVNYYDLCLKYERNIFNIS